MHPLRVMFRLGWDALEAARIAAVLHDVVEGTPIQLHDLLTDADGGTEVVGVHERLPRAMSVADNEAGWRMALARLAALVEADQN